MAHHPSVVRVALVAAVLAHTAVARAEQPDEPGAVLLVPMDQGKEPGLQPGDVVEIHHPLRAGPVVGQVQPRPAVTLQALRPRPPRNRGPFWTLDASLGWGGYAAIFAEEVSGPMLSVAAAVTWGGGRVKHGLRLAGFYSSMNGEVNHLFDESESADSQLWGANIAYVMQVGGFWWSAGWGGIHTRTHSTLAYDADYGSYDSNLEENSWPEGVLALGYDFRLGRHLGLRLFGEMGTFFVTWRAQAGVGLVLRL